MQPIRSGTTAERIVRTSILTLVLSSYSAWSFYDGYVRYPQQNQEALARKLSVPPNPFPKPDPRVTKEAVESVKPRDLAKDVIAKLGQPAVKEGGTWYFFGPVGLGKVIFFGGNAVAAKPVWDPAVHTALDLLFQRVVGSVTGVLGLLMLLQWIRVVTTRLELTDEGLRVNSQGGRAWGGSPLIPFEAMKGLRDPDDRFRKKRSDWVELDYELPDGTSGCVRLNVYVHKAFHEVLPVICQRRRFRNPLEEDVEAEAAGAPPGGESSDGEDHPPKSPGADQAG